MAKTIELTVPDLGGFDDVPVITVFVQAGDTVMKDAPLVELESDKATMEVPASFAGTIRRLNVKVGDRVSQGSVLADVEVADDAPAAANGAAVAAAPASAPSANGSPAVVAPPAAATELTVPDLGGFDDVPVITVFVRAGDVIAKDAPLVELESDKATMEVPAVSAGVVERVLVKVGDRVSQGSVIATLGAPAGQANSVAAPSATGTPASAAPATSAPAQQQAAPAAPSPDVPALASSGSTASTDTGATPPEPKIPANVLAAVVAPAPPSKNGAANGTTGVSDAPVHASPAIRRFARELGVALGGVTGSGPNGRITREDVQNHVKSALARAAAPAVAAPAANATAGGLNLIPWPKIDFTKFGPVERKPLSRIAKLSGANLARNWAMIPHVTQNEDADVTELEAFRKATNAEQKDAKVTMLAFLMKSLVATLRRFPTFNSSLDGDELVLKQYYHLGFAADTPNGLVVPVIRDVDKKGVLEIAVETSALAKKARDGKLGPADMSGATFTVSSLGGIGGTSFTPIINAPEVAILGVSRTATKPVWNGTAFEPRLLLPLSLSYDHRVIDGAAAARFCAHLAGVLADMRKVLL